MTTPMLVDGSDHALGISYLDLAEFIICSGSSADDHLRNHGFILEETGWRLSPVYDINPSADGNGLKLNISEHDNS